MDISLTQINKLFENGKYTELISKIDKNPKKIDFFDEYRMIEVYVLSCYYGKQNVKLINTLNSIKDTSKHPNLIDKIVTILIKNDDLDKIDEILQSQQANHELKKDIGFILLEMEIRGKIKSKNEKKNTIGERINETLNDEDFYKFDLFKRFLDALRLRSRKLYRSKEYGKIISWLEGIIINDYNFEVYQYLLLVYRDQGEKDKVLRECLACLKKLSEPQNYELIMDLLYTIGENEKIVELGDSFDDQMTFRSKLILARSLRKLGDIKRAEDLIQNSKKQVEDKIDRGGEEIISSIGEINQITYSGDIDFSENLLYKILENEKNINQIINENKTREILNLCAKILDGQKRQRLDVALDTAKVLIEKSKYRDAVLLLTPFVRHGINNSANLFDTYLIACHGCGKNDLIKNMIIKNTRNLEVATLDRLAKTLENKRLYPEYKIFLELAPDTAFNSFKFIRTYFNILSVYNEIPDPKEILIKISKIKNIDSSTLIYFIERNSKNENKVKLDKILLTLRIDNLTKIYCRLRIIENEKSGEIEQILQQVEEINLDSIQPSQINLFKKMINEALNIAFYNNLDHEVIEIIKKLNLDNEYDSSIFNSQVRSLIRMKKYDTVKELLNRYNDNISAVNRLRILSEIGEKKLVGEEFKRIEDIDNINSKEQKIIDDLYFKNGMFEKYVSNREIYIHRGDFDLRELTRYFYSQLKLGKSEECKTKYDRLYRRFSHHPEKRVIMAISGYDFALSEKYIEDLELSLLMSPRDINIINTIIDSFMKMERIDIAYYFLKKGLIVDQNNESILTKGHEIFEIFNDLGIDPNKISKNTIVESPIYTDAEVIRSVMKISPQRKDSEKNTKKVAIHSHTLDIGGAERQASYLINLLHKNEVENSSFTLITNKIPNKSDIKDTYYKDIKYKEIDISEYYLPPITDITDKEIMKKISHLNNLKFNRIRSMIKIYSDGGYDIAHTWQDYCNIYGGLAALIAGVDKIIMSARTVSPPKKSILSIRQSRSYEECYKLLLNNKNVILTHNSEYGSNDYMEWLNLDDRKNMVIHNGIDVIRTKKKIDKNIKERLGIKKEDLVVGFVGRFTEDKRPWVFLKIAERILLEAGDKGSNELEKWYLENEKKGLMDEEISNNEVGKNIHFVMVGEGPQFEIAKRIVDNSELMTKNIHLVGYSDNVHNYLSFFDCFLLTSKVEGLPNVIIEAQTHSIPVVSTNAGGSAECFIEGVTGFLAKNNDIFELEKLVLKVLSDPKIKQNIKKKAPKFIKERFGRKVYSANINKLYTRQYI